MEWADPKGDDRAALARDLRAILILALAPAIGLGIGRFAFALLLPDMRASLGWSYAQAGLMNTLNALGYLLGALGAASTARRLGEFRSVWTGSLLCVAGLALSALSGNFAILGAARLLAGFGAALAFVAGGALTAGMAQRHPAQAAFLRSLFYAGPGIGIALSGLITPLLLHRLGPGTWWLAWAVLAALSGVFAMVLLLARHATGRSPAPAEVPAKVTARAMAPMLASYFAFGAGYIAYMTFMIAYVRDSGGGPLLQAAFWTLIGCGAVASPWLWSGIIHRHHGGRAVAILTGLTGLGAVLPLASPSAPALFASALLFGSAFFAVVASTTAFVQRNFSHEAWPAGIALMTISFGLGQTLGPVATGAITDWSGGLSAGLWLSAALLAAAMALAAGQRDLARG